MKFIENLRKIKDISIPILLLSIIITVYESEAHLNPKFNNERSDVI